MTFILYFSLPFHASAGLRKDCHDQGGFYPNIEARCFCFEEAGNFDLHGKKGYWFDPYFSSCKAGSVSTLKTKKQPTEPEAPPSRQDTLIETSDSHLSHSSIPSDFSTPIEADHDFYQFEFRLVRTNHLNSTKAAKGFSNWSNLNRLYAERTNSIHQSQLNESKSRLLEERVRLGGIRNLDYREFNSYLIRLDLVKLNKGGELRKKILAQLEQLERDEDLLETYNYASISSYFSQCIISGAAPLDGTTSTNTYDTWVAYLVRLNPVTKREVVILGVSVASKKGLNYIYHIGIQRSITNKGEMLRDIPNAAIGLFRFAREVISLQYGSEIERTLVNPLPAMRRQIVRGMQKTQNYSLTAIADMDHPTEIQASFFSGCYNSAYSLYELKWQ